MADLQTNNWLNYKQLTGSIYLIIKHHFPTLDKSPQSENFYVSEDKKTLENLKNLRPSLLNLFEKELVNNLFNCSLEQNLKYQQLLSDHIQEWLKSHKKILDDGFFKIDFDNPTHYETASDMLEILTKSVLDVPLILQQYYDPPNSKNLQITEAEKYEEKSISSTPKIKWLAKPAYVAHIIYQLAEKNFIEFPVHNGETNYTGLAERMINTFDFNTAIKSKKYLSEQINPESDNNKLGKSTKAKLKLNIPDLSDLA